MTEELKILDDLVSSVDDKEIKRSLKQKRKNLISQMKEVHRLKKCHEKIIKLTEKKDKEEEKLKSSIKKTILEDESVIASSEEED